MVLSSSDARMASALDLSACGTGDTLSIVAVHQSVQACQQRHPGAEEAQAARICIGFCTGYKIIIISKYRWNCSRQTAAQTSASRCCLQSIAIAQMDERQGASTFMVGTVSRLSRQASKESCSCLSSTSASAAACCLPILLADTTCFKSSTLNTCEAPASFTSDAMLRGTAMSKNLQAELSSQCLS